jgi:Ferritin-like
MAEARIVVENREDLWFLLAEASQLEHMLMLEYLYAGFTLRRGTDEGLTDEQAAAAARWAGALHGIAAQEMLHLALVCNLMSAIGAAPTFTRPNFPQRSNYFPPTVQLDLMPFGDAALVHFLYLERPEGMERLDAEGFVPAPPHEAIRPDGVLPGVQDFATVGHLYRGIADGLSHLVRRFGERAVFVGPTRAQATKEIFRWPQLVPVTDLTSAHAAIEVIIEQGEGARGDWRTAHYGQFFDVWNEYREFLGQDPGFEPARPVTAAFTRQPYDIATTQPLVTDPTARELAELFNLAYEALLQLLTRFFTHTTETDEQLKVLAGAAVGVMTGVVEPLGSALTRLPVGPEYPGRTTGPAFEMYYPMGNFVPWREAAWAVLSERVGVLRDRCAALAGQDQMPVAVQTAAERATNIADQLTLHVPAELRAHSTT